jgi:hypothetical protein
MDTADERFYAQKILEEHLLFNSCTEPCDALDSACVCGATHTASDIIERYCNSVLKQAFPNHKFPNK